MFSKSLSRLRKSLSRLLGVAALSVFLCAPSRAQTIEVGSGIFCSTQEQMERFVAHFDGDETTAISAVNAEENDPTACVYGTVAFFRGPEIETARNKSGAYHIVKVVIVGALTEAGFQAVAPAASFSVESVDERIA
jgi:hypothetical protein